MDASQYLKNLATMAGIDPESETLQELTGNETLQQIEINDDLANQISSNLLTLESAKANSDLNKHFRATILNGLDAEITGLTDSLELPDEVKTAIASEQNSFKRVPLLVNKIAELERQKAGSNAKDTTALNQQIEQLNGQITELREGYETKISDIHSQYAGQMLQSKVNNLLAAYNYALPVSVDTNVLTAQTLVNNQLDKDGLKIVDSPSGLTLKTSENTDFYLQNKKITVKDYFDTVLSSHKLLKVSDKSNGNGQPGNGAGTTADVQPGDGMKSFAAMIDAEIGNLNN